MWPGAPRPQSPNEWRNGSCGPLMAFDVSNLNNIQKPFFSPNQCQVSFAFPYLNKLLKFHIDKRLGPTSQLSALFFSPEKFKRSTFPDQESPHLVKGLQDGHLHTKLHWWNEVTVPKVSILVSSQGVQYGLWHVHSTNIHCLPCAKHFGGYQDK